MAPIEVSLNSAVQTILNLQDFTSNSIIEYSNGANKGDGYMGKIETITIRDKWKSLSLVVKISVRNNKIRKGIPVLEAYKNEIHFYTKILPQLTELQSKVKFARPLDCVPKCFTFCDMENKEYLVLENLKEMGYEMYDCARTMNIEEVEILVKTYAQIHALSFALRVKDKPKYLDLTSTLYSMYMGFLECDVGTKLPECFEFLRICMAEKGIKNRRVDQYAQKVNVIFGEILLDQDIERSCILHGDCWSNNFMFKYQAKNGFKLLKDVKILDWQACYYGSPVLDLSYLLYSGASAEVLKDFHNILKIYHNTLSNALSQLNCDPHTIYPFDTLLEEWKKYCQFGIILGVLVTKIKLTDKCGLSDPADTGTEDNSNYFEEVVTSRTGCDVDEFLRRIEYLFEHLEGIEAFEGDVI